MQPTIRTNPRLRFLALLATYTSVLAAALVVSLLLRFDFDVPTQYWRDLALSGPWILVLKLVLLYALGQFRSLLTFFSLPDAKRLAWAMGLAAVLEMLAWFVLGGTGIIPRGVMVTDLVLSFGGLVALRTAMRVYRERQASPTGAAAGKIKRVLIVGAGASGAALVQEIQARPGMGMEVVALVDDNPAKIGGSIHANPIVGPVARLSEIAAQLAIDRIIIAMPSASPGVIKSVVEAANHAGLEHNILPSVAQVLDRRITVSHLRPVEPEDLLGRPPARLEEEGISDMVRGATIMVTGAGGSIGSELCRQIAAKQPGSLVLVERAEAALFAIEQELVEVCPAATIHPLALDICDAPAMETAFQRHRPALVFHAAAHKHVPLMELQPAEAFKNNVLGTGIVARLAAQHGTRRFVLISTDKAVNPLGVMGMTKRLAEMVISELQREESRCAYSAVRFGNVLGSSGSVVTIFRRQIAAGGPVTVTHPEATRFFMSLTEAAGLILQSAWQAHGGEVFVLEMGSALKIRDLARQMIELSGLEPEREIEIRYTGLRPGEKLREETSHQTEDIRPTGHPQVMSLAETTPPNGTEKAIARLREELHLLTPDQVKERLRGLVLRN